MQRLRDERGAVAIVVALLMVALIGFTALSIDVAAAYAERQRLQIGADAAALAIAQDCANSTAGCGAAAAAVTAQDLAMKNIGDGEPIASVSTLDTAAGIVTVENEGVREFWFAPVLGVQDADIWTSATAIWQAKSGGNTLPLAISLCEIEKLVTANDPTFRFNPDTNKYESANPTGNVVVIKLPHPSQPDGCHEGTPQYVPGGFAWITDGANANCSADTAIGEWVSSDPGNDVGDGCTAAYLKQLVDSGEVVSIPVFDKWTDAQGGANAKYQVYGYAGFRLTGFAFTGNATYKYNSSCSGGGNNQCIEGVFSNIVDSTGSGSPSAPALGSTTVRLTE